MSRAASNPFIWLGLALAFVAISFATHWTVHDVPFLLDDLAAASLLHPEGPLDGERVLKVLWPSEEGFAYNHHFRPLGWASVALDDAFFGFHPEPLRMVALVLHGLIAWVVAVLGWRFARDGRMAPGVVAGLLFLVRPDTAEPVVWIAHRFTLLATLFWLVGLLAALRYATTGRGLGIVFALLMASILSKDSMLTESGALAATPLLLAPRGLRWKRCLVLVGAWAAAVAIVLGLRLACFGVLLPSFEGSGDVASSFDPERILAGLPQVGIVLLNPVFGPNAEDRVLAARLAGAALVAITLLLGTRRAAGPCRFAAPLLLLAVLAAGLPTLQVSWSLEGTRRLYLPAALLCLALGRIACIRGGLILAGILLVFWAVLQVNHHDRWRRTADMVDGVVAEIAARARPEMPTLVDGLPSTWWGIPAFGPTASHLHARFKPPLFPRELAVQGVAPYQLAESMVPVHGPVQVLRFRSRRNEWLPPVDGAPLDLSEVWRSASDGAAETLRVDSPIESALWPGPVGTPTVRLSWPIAGADDPGPAHRVLRCRLRVGDQHTDLLIRIRDKQSPIQRVLYERRDGRWSLSLDFQSQILIDPDDAGQDLGRHYFGPGVAASMEWDLLEVWWPDQAAPGPLPPLASATRSFMLGRGQ